MSKTTTAAATRYETVIGMEVHVELSTRSKVWCGCPVDAHAAPNVNVCPVCSGMPGSLPVLNKTAVDYTLAICAALHCEINSPCHFERKNYYYPDLPKNYQISQNERPLGVGGYLDAVLPDGGVKRVRINNVHLEEDAGKNLHSEGGDYSLVDLNRAGTPLVEIVSEADIRSADEAEAYMKTLRTMLRYLGVSDCKMQEGSIRFEVNISLRPEGTEAFGTKTEIKNLNSIRTALKCIEYERARQAELLDEGGQVVQETRLWDDAALVTRAMRGKETAKDYRYFPDPDLVDLEISGQWLADICSRLPELQPAKRERFIKEYGLPEYDALTLTNDRALADYYEAAVQRHANPKAISNWIMTEAMREIKAQESEDFDPSAFPISPENLGAMVAMIDAERISGKIAKSVFAEMLATGQDPESIVKEKGWGVVSDESALEEHCRAAIAKHPAAAEDIRAGRMKAMGRLVGEVMQLTKGQASPALVNKLLMKLLS
jgi:aspartyl-tRNA(Asn)/glutamyl-tRNA(Gln) amidotransferase subunit B